MTRADSIALLRAQAPHDRLRGARYFIANVLVSDLRFLQECRSRETVGYVKEALDLSISRARDLATSEEVSGSNSDAKDVIRSQAVRVVAGKLLHEIGTPIGLVALAASSEVPNYETSKTKARIDSLRRTFEAVEYLQTAATDPQPTVFDLAEIVSGLSYGIQERYGIKASLQGRKPLPVTTDKRLLELALDNGLRNAAEAVKALNGPQAAHPIVITWGETDVDYWVSILDSGPGLASDTSKLFALGKSFKSKHAGFGLAIAKQAVESIGGSVTLVPGGSGGAKFEVRWGR